jgi:hypothetical protein
MSDLQAGSPITGTDVPGMVSNTEDTAQTGITSGTPAAGSPVCGVAFTAPTTGRVLVQFSAFVDNDTAAQVTYVTIEVREGSMVGSGTVVLAASDLNGFYHEGVNQVRGGMFHPVDGLTPGASYNVRLMHRVLGGTGTVDDRKVIVIPLT